MIKRRLFYAIAIPIVSAIFIAAFILSHFIERPIALSVREDLRGLLYNAALKAIEGCDRNHQHIIDLRLESNKEAVDTAKRDSIEQVIRLPSLLNKPEMNIFIVSENRDILSDPSLKGKMRFKDLDSEGFISFSSEKELFFGYYYWFPAWRWYVIAALPESVIEKRLSVIRNSIYTGMLALIASLLTVTFIIIRFKVINPLKAISKVSERIRGGRFEKMDIAPNSYEIDSLMLSFNSMVDAIKKRTEDLERFKRMVESAFDAIIITDRAGNIVYVNPAFETATGYSKDEVIGQNPEIVKSLGHDNEFYKSLWQTINTGKPWKGEFITRKKNEEIYQTSATIFPIISDSGEITHFVSIQRDITEEKKLYDQLLRAQKMEAVGTLAGGIAHDFNNLLAAVIGYSQLIKMKLTEDDPLWKPINIIESAAQKGAELAKKILTITRKEKLEMKRIDLNAAIKDMMELLLRTIPKDITIELNLEDELPCIKADPTQLQQVILNLSVNARDAMPNGGKLCIETDRVGKENGAANGIPKRNGFVKLSVSDTGVGMDRETMRKVFDPFFTTKEPGKGTGLGLYIVHSIVASHGGYINLYSEPGKGTRFNIYFPVCEKEAEESDTNETETLLGSGTILVIDDEENIRELAADMLEPFGYRVITAKNGIDGINTFKTMGRGISLVLLDMIMPQMNGAEVFQVLKTIDPDVRVLLFSGYSHESFAGINGLIKDGARGFLQKPFSLQTIAKAIKKALE